MFNRGMSYKKPRGNHFGANRGNNNRRRNGSLSIVELERSISAGKTAVLALQSAAPVEIQTCSFNDFGLNNVVLSNVKNKGYEVPTPIQCKSMSIIVQGSDLIGIANTGTGKTAAFLLPLITKVMKDRTQKVLIVAPTRELAFQIDEEFRVFSKFTGILSTVCIGGASMFNQKRALRANPNFVIGTPGRIKDLYNQRSLNLHEFNNVVLDEADRMVDIGFINEIKFFISKLPEQRQSLFFSATVSIKVTEIINTFVKNPVTVSVKSRETAGNIVQELVRIRDAKKVDVLHDLLIRPEVSKTLIFGRTKHGVEKLGKELITRGFQAAAIHGDKRQSQRQSIIKRFKDNEIKVLLATDVASRGLDINNITHVINYDLPETYEDYVHRIGRTGRGTQSGTAYTLIED